MWPPSIIGDTTDFIYWCLSLICLTMFSISNFHIDQMIVKTESSQLSIRFPY